jgi:hypothetical protein
MNENFKPGDYEGENQNLKVIQEGSEKNIEAQKKKVKCRRVPVGEFKLMKVKRLRGG